MNRKNLLKKLVLCISILILGGLLLYKVWPLQSINFDTVGDYINSYGNLSYLIFILIFNIKTLLVFFPHSIVVVLGGRLFGHICGFLISMFCVFTTSTFAFFISRLTGKHTVEKLLKGRMKSLESKVGEHGFKIIFLMRVSIIFPQDALSFAAGLTKVRYSEFILATLLGVIPETFSLSMLGQNIGNPFSWSFIGSILLVLVTVAIPYFVEKKKKQRKSM